MWAVWWKPPWRALDESKRVGFAFRRSSAVRRALHLNETSSLKGWYFCASFRKPEKDWGNGELRS